MSEVTGDSGGVSPRDLGADLLRQGRFAEAADALRRATDADPADEGAWRLLGGALASTGDGAGAVAAFRRAAEAAPDSAKNQYNLAVALQSAGQPGEARERLQQALALDPAYEQARARLADLDAAPTPAPAPAAGPGLAPLSPVGGGAPAPAPLTPVGGDAPPPAGAYPPPPPGGYAPPPPGGAYPPPPPGAPYGQQPVGYPGAPPPPLLGPGAGGPGYAPAPAVSGNAILTMAILGFCCGILAPISWLLAQNALKTLDQYPNADQSQRGVINAGRIVAIIGTVFFVIGIVARIGLTFMRVGSRLGR